MVALKESHLAELGWHEESQPALRSDRESLNDKKGPVWSCECENLIPGHFSLGGAPNMCTFRVKRLV